MEINKYALFADIADTLNFTKSGGNMGYTQSGVSHILKSMETELGFPLFLRTKQGLVLTHNAEKLLPYIRKLLAANEELDQIVNALNGLETGHITIACFASISRNWLPHVIYQFRNKYPGIEIELLEGGTDDIVNWIREMKADFGLLSHRKVKNLEWLSLENDPLMAILPKDYPLDGRNAFPVKEFSGHPFIISAEGVDYDVHQALEDASITPDIPFSSKDDHVIVSMVASRLGLSILPGLVIKGVEHEITAVPLEPYYSRELGIAFLSKKSLSPAAVRFVTEMQEWVESREKVPAL